MFQQMKYFIAVVEYHNFTRAAESCNISQSAISQQIKELERTVGTALLERQGRSFKLTSAGEYFYRHVKSLLKETDQILQETQMIAHKNEEYTIRLGYLTNFGSTEFLQVIAQFSQDFPNVNVKIKSGMHEELFNLLKDDVIDLNFSDQRRALSDEYNNELLTTTDFMAVVPHQFAANAQITTADLAETPCILVVPPEYAHQEEEYYRDVLGVQSRFVHTNSIDEAQMMVVANQGFMIVNGRTIETINQTVAKVIPLYNGKIPLRQNYYAYWKKDNSGYYIEKFAEVLKAQFSKKSKE